MGEYLDNHPFIAFQINFYTQDYPYSAATTTHVAIERIQNLISIVRSQSESLSISKCYPAEISNLAGTLVCNYIGVEPVTLGQLEMGYMRRM